MEIEEVAELEKLDKHTRELIGEDDELSKINYFGFLHLIPFFFLIYYVNRGLYLGISQLWNRGVAIQEFFVIMSTLWIFIVLMSKTK